MTKSKSKSPLVAWQHGPIRIVCSTEECEHGVEEPNLVIEAMFRDALNEPAWRPVSFGLIAKQDPDLADIIFALALDVVSRVEVAPLWIRTFVAEMREDFGRRRSIDDVPEEESVPGAS